MSANVIDRNNAEDINNSDLTAVEEKIDVRNIPPTEYDTPAYKKRKRRWGDRKEGRKLRSIPPMNIFMP